ncbi:hypothetical protein [Streptomyces sp. NPDC051183]|uniref:hypothetical protein n=1 Tax=unclassified Streptomyces TaxID=2593676 RepID=UPI00342E9964
MQFKRIAAVAAAAVVGPTVLMTTPAMANEQQPSASVPDTAPKADATPAAETAPVTAPAPETAPAAPAPAAEKTAEARDAAPDTRLLGPEVTLAGIPRDGFKPGAGWTPLTLTIDNSGHTEVTRFTPRVALGQSGDKLAPEHYKIEYLDADRSWKPAELANAGEIGVMDQFTIGMPSTIARGETRTVQLRISFAAGAPVIAFDMVSSGVSRRADGGNAWSPTKGYDAKIAGAADDNNTPTVIDGPAFTLTGVPSDGFKVGGDWQDLNLHMDNSGKPAQANYAVSVVLARLDGAGLYTSQLQAEIYGKNGWEPLEGYAESSKLHLEFGNVPFTAGQVSDVKLRVRFSAGTKPGDVVFFAHGIGPFDGPNYSYTVSQSAKHLTRLVAADPATGDTGSTGNQPEPNGGTSTTPISTGTGTGTGTGASTGTGTGTGGELAATGSGPATTWAVGGAGVALAMGAALVAGTGRHRRRTTA